MQQEKLDPKHVTRILMDNGFVYIGQTRTDYWTKETWVRGNSAVTLTIKDGKPSFFDCTLLKLQSGEVLIVT